MSFSPRSVVLLVTTLLALVIGASLVASQVLMPRPAPIVATTPPAAALALAFAASVTPTPRVITVPASPTPDPTTATTRLLTVEPEQATAQSTSPVTTPRAITSAPAVQVPTAIPSSTPMPSPTREPAPTAVPLLSATLPPTSAPELAPLAVTDTPMPPSVPVVTLAPASPSTLTPPRAARLTFTADQWAGGFYRGDGRAYGRPWTAVYGAYSAYPRAAVSFALDAAPAEAATLVVTGLDDEWAAPNEIVLEVNGQPLFSGAAPFANWDGIGDGSQAAWTRVQITVPAGVLQAGVNEIALANLTPSSNFNMPPYVLVSDLTLQFGPLDVALPDAPAIVAATEGGRQNHNGDGATAGKKKDQKDKDKNKDEKKNKKDKNTRNKNRSKQSSDD